MSFLIKMVVNRRVDRGKFLKRLYAPELCHCPLSPPKRLMRVFGSIVQPVTGLLACLNPEILHRQPVGTEPVRHNRLWAAVSPYCFAQEPQGGFAISSLCKKRFEDFSLVINSAPEIVDVAIDPNENLIQMPTLMDPVQVIRNALLPNTGYTATAPTQQLTTSTSRCSTLIARLQQIAKQI